MKIFQVGTAYPHRGGIAHFNNLLYKTLKKRGHTVKIISFKRQYPSIFFPGKTQYEKDEKYKVETFPLIDSVNPFNWLKVGKQLADEKPDVIIFHHWMPFFGPAFGTVAKRVKKAGAKVVFICHNIIPHEKQPLGTFLTKWVLRKSDSYIVLSEKEKRDLKTIVINPDVKVVFHPVYEIFNTDISDEQSRKELELENQNVVLFFGHIRKYKGLEVLLQAVKIAKEKVNFKLIVAGEFYDGEEKYRTLINELGISENVLLFDEFIPTEKVGMYFKASDVVILPYLSATQSGVIQICYNFDRPVIATRVGGLPEFIDENKTGMLVPPNDPQAIADAIVKFYDKNLKVEYSENIKLFKQQFSWENMAKEIESFLPSA